MVDLSCNDRKRLSEASLGKIVNDKVFRNIKVKVKWNKDEDWNNWYRCNS